MTTLGKILVIVILLLSLVEGALLLQVYERRTNWAAAFAKLKEEFDVMQKNADTYRDRLQVQEEQYENKIKTIEAAKQDLETKLNDANARVEAEKRKVEDHHKRAETAEQNVKQATSEKDRRRKEMEDLKAALQQREQAILRLEEESKKNRQAFITADVELKSTRERNEQLLAQNQDLVKEMERVRAGGSLAQRPVATAQKPPADVEGVVTEVDPKAGLLTISLGSDAGLAKGNTLEVYRLKPEPKYLGRILLLDVRHHQAVGKPVDVQRQAQIQKGDKVATSIMAGR